MTTPRLPKLTSNVPQLPPRPAAAHKGMTGRVGIIAGSRGMSGAAVLTALGALRSGAGLVRVHCPASILPIVAASEPCYMTVPLAETEHGRIDHGGALGQIDFAWPDVLAIGPGLGQSHSLADFLADVLVQFKGPVVVDADALNNLAPRGLDVWRERGDRPTILSPHPGEMDRLRAGAGLEAVPPRDDRTRLAIAHDYAMLARVTVVLKGHRTVVCAPDQAFVNTTGNPGMATGGMGDVLTGVIAALVGQGLDAYSAARLGVYVHGLAADHCAKQIAPVGYTARDVADGIPAALAEACRPRIGFVP